MTRASGGGSVGATWFDGPSNSGNGGSGNGGGSPGGRGGSGIVILKY